MQENEKLSRAGHGAESNSLISYEGAQWLVLQLRRRLETEHELGKLFDYLAPLIAYTSSRLGLSEREEQELASNSAFQVGWAPRLEREDAGIYDRLGSMLASDRIGRTFLDLVEKGLIEIKEILASQGLALPEDVDSR